METEKIFTGAIEDTRPKEEKAKDWQYDEVASSVRLNWKPLGTQSPYPIRNQSSSGSCVAQSLALILSIENLQEEGRFIEFSASDIYQRRVNRPSGGMVGNDALEIVTKTGATLEQLMPSQNLNEQQINAVPRKPSDEQIGKIYRGASYIHIPFNIDRIAQAMEQYKVGNTLQPIMVWFRFFFDEWTGVPTIRRPITPESVHHAVVAIDYGMYEGEKAILIQDSWGHQSTPFGGTRVIKESFLSRMTHCSTIIDLPNTWRDGVPVTQGMIQKVELPLSQDDVRIIQDTLKIDGFFPRSQASTGVYGNITRTAVRSFQTKHNLVADGVIGRITLEKLKEVYK